MSYKSHEEVKAALTISLQSQKLFSALSARKQIHFNSPVRAKCSYVIYLNKALVLYRYKVDDGGENEFKMAFLRSHPDSEYFLFALGTIFEQLAAMGEVRRE